MDALWAILKVLIGLALVFVLMGAFPWLLSLVWDTRNKRIIHAHCQALGFTDVEIKLWPNHYGVTFKREGQSHYAKCKVKRRQVQWLGKTPVFLRDPRPA